MRITRVTIVQKPVSLSQTQNINDLLLLLGQSLGLFGLRDKDKSCYRIFIILVKALRVRVELTSDDIAAQTGLSRGTVVHHLNRLMDAGIVVNSRNKYFINHDTLQSMVEEFREAMNKMIDQMAGVAKTIDDALNLR